MNINRRKFFRVCAAGMAAASIPTFLQPEKVQGKIIKPEGWYAWEEVGFAILDNRRILLGDINYTEEEFAKALEVPLRKPVMSNDVINSVFEKTEIKSKEFGDPLIFPKNDVESSIDWLLEYCKDARWDLVSRAHKIMEESFAKSINNARV